MTTTQKKKVWYKLRNEGPERREIALGIGGIHKKVTRSSHKYLDEADLCNLCIDVSSMDPNTGKSDTVQDPFFVPLGRDVIDQEWAKMDPEIEWPDLDFSSRKTSPLRVGSMISQIALLDSNS